MSTGALEELDKSDKPLLSRDLLGTQVTRQRYGTRHFPRKHSLELVYRGLSQIFSKIQQFNLVLEADERTLGHIFRRNTPRSNPASIVDIIYCFRTKMMTKEERVISFEPSSRRQRWEPARTCTASLDRDEVR